MKLLWSSSGRIGRRQWWLGVTCLAIVVVVVTVLLAAIAIQVAPPLADSDLMQQATGPLMVFVHWLLTLPLNIKRGHDRGRPGGWQLLGLVPVAYIWLLVDHGFFRSVPANEWGPPAVPAEPVL